MKNLTTILTGILAILLSGCVRDDISQCPGFAYFYCSYLYGGKNCFYDYVNTDLHFNFYQDTQYRYDEIPEGTHGPKQPVQLQKSLHMGKIETVVWSHDDALTYHHSDSMTSEECYVRLKEITPGSDICRPVDDLFLARTTFVSERLRRSEVALDFDRAVSRVHITLIPSSVQPDGEAGLLPNLKDYEFHLRGTYDCLDYTGYAKGKEIIISPEVHYNEATRNMDTNWFGAMPSAKNADGTEKYLAVDVYLRGTKVTTFDCAPLELTSVANRFIDIVIDGRYVRPEMSIYVNGWKLGIVECDV